MEPTETCTRFLGSVASWNSVGRPARGLVVLKVTEDGGLSGAGQGVLEREGGNLDILGRRKCWSLRL